MTTVSREVLQRWDKLKANGQERQRRNETVAAARRGELNTVMPGVFPTNWPKPVVANILDTSARDSAEILAQLPAIDCSSSQLTSDRAKKFSSKRTKIALSYIEHSRLKLQLFSGCDWFGTFAAMPIIVEADFAKMMPCFRIDDPRGAFWELDFYGNTRIYGKCWSDTVSSLSAKFPELADKIKGDQPAVLFGPAPDRSNDKLEVVKLYYDNKVCLFLPERDGLVLSEYEHKLSSPPVVICERPKWDDQGRGTFDDVMWVWLARARMALYGLEAADKSVRAPIALPDDVTELSFGGDAILRSATPEKIQRVPLEIPQSSLIESQLLDKEIADGTRTPAARRGDVDASIITGRGVEALTSIYQTQIATAQTIIGDGLRRAIGMAFQLDELYWPNVKKTVHGLSSGAPFTESYTPAADIRGDYSVTVTYGMTAGMDPNRAIVFLLQARADQLIDRDTVQRMLPFEIDVEDLQRRVDIEQIEDALKQGLFALLANAPAMSMQGMDPLKSLMQAAQIVKDRQNGVPIHEAILKAFQPTPEEQQQANDPMAQLQALAAGGGAPQQTPGDQTALYGAGTAPDVSMLLAGLTSGGNPNLQANVSRRLGTGI